MTEEEKKNLTDACIEILNVTLGSDIAPPRADTLVRVVADILSIVKNSKAL